MYSYFPVTTAFALASQQSRNRIHGTTMLTISDDTWRPDDPPSFFADRRAHHSASPDICWLIASPVRSPAQWSLLQIIKRVSKASIVALVKGSKVEIASAQHSATMSNKCLSRICHSPVHPVTWSVWRWWLSSKSCSLDGEVWFSTFNMTSHVCPTRFQQIVGSPSSEPDEGEQK